MVTALIYIPRTITMLSIWSHVGGAAAADDDVGADGVDDGGGDGADGVDDGDGGARCLGSILRGCTPRTSVGTKNLDWDPTRRRRTYGSSENIYYCIAYILYTGIHNSICMLRSTCVYKGKGCRLELTRLLI